MKKQLSFFGIILGLIFFMSSCQVIGDIFKAGMWVGVLGVVAVVGIIIWIISKVAGGGGDK